MTGVLSLFDLTGRKAVVTGAGQGLGKAMALALAQAGADVAAVDIRVDTAEQAAAEMRALGRNSFALACDVSDTGQVTRMAETVLERFGAAHILVNNAGISRHTPSERMPLADWTVVMDVNMTGVWLGSQAFAPAMIAQHYGRIINISSMSGLIVNRDVPQAPILRLEGGREHADEGARGGVGAAQHHGERHRARLYAHPVERRAALRSDPHRAVDGHDPHAPHRRAGRPGGRGLCSSPPTPRPTLPATSWW